MQRSSAQIAVELQSKFELYFLGLIFTVLGLSVQTAQFGRSGIADGCELAAWILLLVAALSGLLRGEWSPVIFQIFDKEASVEKRIDEIESQLDAGVNQRVTFVNGSQEEEHIPAEAALVRLRGVLQELVKQRKDAEQRLRHRYGLMKWCFLAGTVLLVMARGYIAARELFLKAALFYSGVTG